jgi:tetratricopeptide (TPR) repeat protein
MIGLALGFKTPPQFGVEISLPEFLSLRYDSSLRGVRVAPNATHLVAKMDVSGRSFRFLRREMVFAVGLAALTLAVYGPVYRFEFLEYDDPFYVSSNPAILSGLNLGGVHWAFEGVHAGWWIPTTWLSLMLDATCYGSWPGGYHITNALLHLANVLLVFAIFARATGNPRSSALIAALFAVHPLHAESVAWITERKDVLSMFFGLLSVFAYVRYAQLDRAAPRRALVALTLALVFCVCSLMSKQTFVTLPFLFLLLDYWPLGRLGIGPARAAGDAGNPTAAAGALSGQFPRVGLLVLEKVPFFAAGAVFCLVAVWGQQSNRMIQSLATYPLATRCLNAVVAYALYVSKAVFPVGLAVVYPHPGGGQLGVARVGLAALLLAALTLIAIAQVRRRPFLLVGWLWFLGTLVPTIGIVQCGDQQMADRFAYLPAIGLYVAVVAFVGSVVPATPLAKRGLAVVVIGVYAALGFVQVAQWHDGVRLFRHALAVADDNPLTRYHLAYALYRREEYSEALVHLQRAIDLAPSDPRANYIAASTLQALGRSDEATAQFQRAMALDDGHVVQVQHNPGRPLWISPTEPRDPQPEFLKLEEFNVMQPLGRTVQ